MTRSPYFIFEWHKGGVEIKRLKVKAGESER